APDDEGRRQGEARLSLRHRLRRPRAAAADRARRAARVRGGAARDREEVDLARRGAGGPAGAPAPRPPREQPRSNGAYGLVEGRGGGGSRPPPGRLPRSSGGILLGAGAPPPRPARRGRGPGGAAVWPRTPPPRSRPRRRRRR